MLFPKISTGHRYRMDCQRRKLPHPPVAWLGVFPQPTRPTRHAFARLSSRNPQGDPPALLKSRLEKGMDSDCSIEQSTSSLRCLSGTRGRGWYCRPCGRQSTGSTQPWALPPGPACPIARWIRLVSRSLLTAIAQPACRLVHTAPHSAATWAVCSLLPRPTSPPVLCITSLQARQLPALRGSTRSCPLPSTLSLPGRRLTRLAHPTPASSGMRGAAGHPTAAGGRRRWAAAAPTGSSSRGRPSGACPGARWAARSTTLPRRGEPEPATMVAVPLCSSTLCAQLMAHHTRLAAPLPCLLLMIAAAVVLQSVRQ